jgi:adenylosuccinate synthase
MYVGSMDESISLQPGDHITVMRPEDDILRNCKPIYKYLHGWDEDISEVKKYDDLPDNAQKYLRFIEFQAGVMISMVSVGPDREQTFFI